MYRDAEKLLKLGSDDGKPLTPMEAVKEAIRLRGGRDKCPGSRQDDQHTGRKAHDSSASAAFHRRPANAPIDFENDDPRRSTAPRRRTLAEHRVTRT